MKAFADDKINVTKELKFVLGREENIMGKGENDKILNETKLKAVADNKSNVARMTIALFDRVENTVGKGENADCQHFLHFPQYFQKASFLEVIKVGIMW